MVCPGFCSGSGLCGYAEDLAFSVGGVDCTDCLRHPSISPSLAPVSPESLCNCTSEGRQIDPDGDWCWLDGSPCRDLTGKPISGEKLRCLNNKMEPRVDCDIGIIQ